MSNLQSQSVDPQLARMFNYQGGSLNTQQEQQIQRIRNQSIQQAQTLLGECPDSARRTQLLEELEAWTGRAYSLVLEQTGMSGRAGGTT